MSDLGSWAGISDELFISVPLSAILAELDVKAGHKCTKHSTTLGEHT